MKICHSLKKAKIEDVTHVDSQDRMIDNCSKSLTTDVINEECQSEIVTRSKDAVEPSSCAKSCEVRVGIGIKRKRLIEVWLNPQVRLIMEVMITAWDLGIMHYY